MKYSDKVLIEKNTDSKKRTPESIRRNPHAVDNVNQTQGPRVGMASAHAGKRGVFREAKTEREPLADMVMGMFSTRENNLDKNPGDHVARDGGSISSNNPRRELPKSNTGATRTRKR